MSDESWHFLAVQGPKAIESGGNLSYAVNLSEGKYLSFSTVGRICGVKKD